MKHQTRTKILSISIRRLQLFPIAFLLHLSIFGQSQAGQLTQQVRGVVIDQILQSPVSGATIRLPLLNLTTVSDAQGNFRFKQVPVGSQQIIVSSVGFKELVTENVNVIAGKETLVTLALETNISRNEAIIVRSSGRRNKPLNEMSQVSARAFSVEETQKYAAAVNDPSRMATAFPGVVSTDDGNNMISIRGNSPTGLLWRMEGVEIPNPNHFSSTGSSGGGISILSSQLLSNSDFITGAFAAEYGNALSGVFDLRLRKGNNEKREYTLQAGVLGLNLAAEGPFLPFYKGSYLINYRYSTLQLLNKAGIVKGGATNFQDLSYNFYFPTKRLGSFTLFGFGGLSSQNQKAVKDSSTWHGASDRYVSKFVSNTGATGLTHSILLNDKLSLRSAVVVSNNRIVDNFSYITDEYLLREDYNDHFNNKKLTVNTLLNYKLSSRSLLRINGTIDFLSFRFYQQQRPNAGEPMETQISTQDKTQLLQASAQWQYKLSNDLTFTSGLHFQRFMYNGSQAVEPRLAVKWQMDPKNHLAFGFGQHSQIQALGVYFARQENSNGTTVYPNRDLGFSRANHYVLSFRHSFNASLSLKTEFYYQHLYHIPVSTFDTSSFSMLNVSSEYITDPLVNKGKGKNYGVEISLEKYLSNHLYYTLSNSLYQSKYTAADKVERNTKFNGNYVSTLIAGKEFITKGGRKTFGINIKTIYAGGLRTTPIDLNRSVSEDKAVFFDEQAYSLQNPAYFRTDLRVSLKLNRKHLTSTLSLDIQNLSNRLNVYGQWYDNEKKEIVTTYQTGLIPVLNYKVEF